MCACTWRRSSAIIFCADLDSSCVSVKEVSPCRTVAARTPSTMGVSSWTCRLPITWYTRCFVEVGKTNQDRRLMAISKKPSAKSPRLGFISAQTSGRFFHAFLRFSPLAGDLAAVSVFMICEANFTQTVRCQTRLNNYIAKRGRKASLNSIARGSRAWHAGPAGAIEAQHAGDEFAHGDTEVAPQSAFQTGVILRAAEEIAHQFPEHWAAPQELNHARGDRAAEKGATIEAPHNARRKLQLGAESSLHPSRVLLRAAFRERSAQQFTGSNGVEKAFACEGIDPRGGISDESPVLSDYISVRKRALLR